MNLSPTTKPRGPKPAPLPATMKAARAAQRGGELELTTIPTPAPAPGQVLIRVEAAGVNFSDLMRRRGDTYPFPTAFPFVPGGEVAGTVVAVGAGVETPAVGTRVFALAGDDGSGGYAQFALAWAQTAIPVPDGVSSEVASVLTVAGATAKVVLAHAARLEAGETVLIPAATGGVGSFALQIARQRKAGKIVAAVGSPEKRARALAMGADEVVVLEGTDWPERVLAVTDGRGVDVALEATGGPALESTLRCLAPFGRLVVYGFASGTPASLSADATTRLLYAPAANQSITGFNIGGWFMQRGQVAGPMLGELLGDVARGVVTAPPIRTYPLARAADAHEALARRATHGKLVVSPWT